MLTPQSLAQLLDTLPHETRNVEHKGPGPMSDPLLGQVLRAMHGLVNIRDGGYVLVGVDDSANPSGLSASDLATWNHDDLADQVARYAQPVIEFDSAAVIPSGHTLPILVVAVREFAEVPVICQRDRPEPGAKGRLFLRGGALYVRRRGKPSTSEVPDAAEMRELLDLAMEKRLSAFLGVAQRAGLQVGGERDVDAYDEELKRFSSE
jgi:hypothetical protein